MHRFMLVGLVLVVAAVSAPGQDGVTFKPNIPAPGQRVKTTIEEKSTQTTGITVKGAAAQKKDEAKTKSFVYVDETLENADMGKRATKLKRTYEKAVVSANGVTQTLPAEGRTVLIEKSGGKYAFTIDGKPAASEAALLEAEFNKSDNLDGPEMFFPKTPVKAGDSWKVDKAPLLKMLSASGIMLDDDKAVSNGTLTKTYKKGQSQYGDVVFTFETPIIGLGPKAPVKLDDGKMSLKVEGEGCLDGATPDGKTVMHLQFSVKGSAMGIDIDIKNETTETRTVELLKK